MTHKNGITLMPRELTIHVFVFLGLFSGPRRPGDLECWIRQLCYEEGFHCVVVSYDPFVNTLFDILDNNQFSMLRKILLHWEGGWTSWGTCLQHLV